MTLEALTFDSYAAEQAKHAALATVDGHADATWLDRAAYILRDLAHHQYRITSDDVWALLALEDEETHDGRALANVFLRAKREHLIRKSSERVICRRRSRHAAEIPVWISEVLSQ